MSEKFKVGDRVKIFDGRYGTITGPARTFDWRVRIERDEVLYPDTTPVPFFEYELELAS